MASFMPLATPPAYYSTEEPLEVPPPPTPSIMQLDNTNHNHWTGTWPLVGARSSTGTLDFPRRCLAYEPLEPSYADFQQFGGTPNQSISLPVSQNHTNAFQLCPSIQSLQAAFPQPLSPLLYTGSDNNFHFERVPRESQVELTSEYTEIQHLADERLSAKGTGNFPGSEVISLYQETPSPYNFLVDDKDWVQINYGGSSEFSYLRSYYETIGAPQNSGIGGEELRGSASSVDPAGSGTMYQSTRLGSIGILSTQMAQVVGPSQPRPTCMRSGCNMTFGRASDLERHVQAVHNRRRYHCEVQGCSNNHGKGYSRADKLKCHVVAKHARPA